MNNQKKKKHVAIVLAAGKGTRMNADCPKQFIDILGKPLICHTLEAFQESFIDEIILVTSDGWLEYCKHDIVEAYHIDKVTAVITGGAQRYDSVYAGICHAEDADYLYVHDGARPAVTSTMLERARRTVEQYGVAIAGMPSKDTIKVVDAGGKVISTPDRSTLWNVQTPQVFDRTLLLEMYERMYNEKLYEKISITDDAMLLEHLSDADVMMYEGDYCNIKVTTPEDLILIENILKK